MKNEFNKKKQKANDSIFSDKSIPLKKTKINLVLDRRFNFENKQNVSYFFSRKSSHFQKIASGTFELFVVSSGTPDNS